MTPPRGHILGPEDPIVGRDRRAQAHPGEGSGGPLRGAFPQLLRQPQAIASVIQGAGLGGLRQSFPKCASAVGWGNMGGLGRGPPCCGHLHCSLVPGLPT